MAGNRFPADGIKGAAIILQGEIDMAGGGTGRARDFGPHTHKVKRILNRRLQPPGKLADSQKRRIGPAITR